MKKYKCLDFYSGIGGWTMGMKLSNISNSGSYEWFKESNTTHNLNFKSNIKEIDIRKLDFSTLPNPGTIDFIVGSPPCTQFSLSNKGGGGDIDEGLIDVFQFLRIVEYLKPKYWVMENVPRVKNIINKIINEDKKFKRFKKLISFNEIVDCSEFGLPQKRKRMLCGNFPYDLFNSYKNKCKTMTMGDVITSLDNNHIIDPIYGYKIPKKELTDHNKEQTLTYEELRLNKESKTYHPVYNNMNFPDLLDRPSRTITGTCTRVSRESIVIKDGKNYRRLTLREKGMIQGFPITYQFYGNSFSSKQLMIGNSIPPVLTYYIFQSMLKVKVEDLKEICNNNLYYHNKPIKDVPNTPSEKYRGNYRKNRSFRFSLPGLRFGSGVRFELSNKNEDKINLWSIKFFYGNSKNIKSIDLGSKKINNMIDKYFLKEYKSLKKLNPVIDSLSSSKLQNVWTHSVKDDCIHPYEFLDIIGEFVLKLDSLIKKNNFEDSILKHTLGEDCNKKLIDNKSLVITGILLGNYINKNLKNEN